MHWKMTERVPADVGRAMGEAQLRRKDKEAGQSNLFDLMGGGNDESADSTLIFTAQSFLMF